MLSVKKFFVALLVFTTALSIAGCGSGTNNDQGTSFLNLGYFQDADGSIGATGLTYSISEDSVVEAFSSDSGSNDVRVFMRNQNLLSQQFIRLVRINCDYDSQGNSFRIPSQSFATNALIEPTEGLGGSSTTTTFYSEFPILSAEILKFVGGNLNSFPELPFTIVASCSATGITQAGDVLETNSQFFPIAFR